MPNLDDTILILASAAFGGTGAKIIDAIIQKHRNKIDTTAQIRKELRADAETLRLENARILAELDDWKQKYFEVLQELNSVRLELERIRIELGMPPHTD